MQAASAQAVASDGSGQVRARCHGGPCDHRCRSTNCGTATETHGGHRVAGAHMRRQHPTGRWWRCHHGDSGRWLRWRRAAGGGGGGCGQRRGASAIRPRHREEFAGRCWIHSGGTLAHNVDIKRGTYSVRGRRSDSTSLGHFNPQRCGAAPVLSYPGRAEAARWSRSPSAIPCSSALRC